MDNLSQCKLLSMEKICTTCLSTNRRLFLLENANISWFDIQFHKEAKVCWECKRFLAKIQTFREQVIKAQLFLTSYDKKLTIPISLSNLKICHKDSYDRVYQLIDTTEIIKDETSAIKEEPMDEDDSELDLGEATVLPTEYTFTSAGTSQELAEASPENITKDSTERSSREEGENESAPCYVVTYVSEEVMMQDRQKLLNSKRFKKAQYKCETCITQFTMLKTYEKHRRTKHSEYYRFRHPCAVCAQRFESAAEARDHARAHRRYLRCGACAFQHRKAAVVEAHYESQHEARRVYPCHLCDRKFLTRRKKKAHVQSEHGEAALCQLCNKTFCNPSSLKLHLKTHADLPRVECPICRRQYKGEHTLSQHLKTHEPRAEPAEAYCAECDVRFKTRVALNSHLRYSIRHVSEDSFKHQCNECGRRFAMKYKLEDHIEREHLRIYKYACEHCGKKFMSGLQKRSHLNKSHHVNAAVVDKRATCQICGKEFSSASTCKKHQRVHTGERPYHCQLCPMQFSQGSTLRTHIRGKHKDHVGTV